jgi:hypothetical protein
MNPTNINEVTPNAIERRAEIAEILALGLVRLWARQSSGICADRGDSSLYCVAGQSGHANSKAENG